MLDVYGTEEVRVSVSSTDSSTNIQDRFLLGASLLATFLPYIFSTSKIKYLNALPLTSRNECVLAIKFIVIKIIQVPVNRPAHAKKILLNP